MTFKDPQHEINEKFRKLEEQKYGKVKKRNTYRLMDAFLHPDYDEVELEDLMDWSEYKREHLE